MECVMPVEQALCGRGLQLRSQRRVHHERWFYVVERPFADTVGDESSLCLVCVDE
jgi:hypothetical protein